MDRRAAWTVERVPSGEAWVVPAIAVKHSDTCSAFFRVSNALGRSNAAAVLRYADATYRTASEWPLSCRGARDTASAPYLPNQLLLCKHMSKGGGRWFSAQGLLCGEEAVDGE